jgi:hypothetical protein
MALIFHSSMRVPAGRRCVCIGSMSPHALKNTATKRTRDARVPPGGGGPVG